ncbi:GNAT family N-acetyltransferase [Undibacterium sp. Ji22W]|uniref:GNAT family N-acetyltransferase n=1 Tax=Undibacterium sp. Ji22W TaxID=3413038 RepID=UPI003BF2FF9E
MKKIILRDALPKDFESILALNDAEVQQTSAMDFQKLSQLASLSAYHKVALVDDKIAAFLLAMRENTAYQSENYRWFAARYPHFIYVDRIVVSAEFGGLKIGSLLYTDLFDFARAHGIAMVTCEYNIQPPNPASQKFHDKFGFKEIDTQWVANGSKQVSLQVAELA